MRTSSGSKNEAELTKDARRKKLPKPAWHDGDIDEVTEDISQAGNEMFKCIVSFTDPAGETWKVITYLLDTPKTALLFRHACAARGVLAQFEAGSVEASDLLGPCRVKIGIEKGRRGWPDRLRVEDFAPPASASSVVQNLRSAG